MSTIMLNRIKNPSQKPVLIISDVPVKSEIAGFTEMVDGEIQVYHSPWNSSSNLNMLTSLRTGKVSPYSLINEDFKGIKKTQIHTTYLDYSYFGNIDGNFDFNKEVVRTKDRVEGENYVQIPVHKNLYVSERLYNEFSALLSEIKKVNPKLIIVVGKWSLFFLTLRSTLSETAGTKVTKKPLGSLVKFRASLMDIHEVWGDSEKRIVFPMWHTIHSISMPDKIHIFENDLLRVGATFHTIMSEGIEYYYSDDTNPILGTTKEIVLSYLNDAIQKLDKEVLLASVDVETAQKKVIDCVGIALNEKEGICIPFCTTQAKKTKDKDKMETFIVSPNFWSKEDELEILFKLKTFLEHPNIRFLGQNFSYDCQYFLRNWGIEVKAAEDTMILQNIMYNHLPKDLTFLASQYCNKYRIWEDEISSTEENPESRWFYNIKDVINTYEVFLAQNAQLESEPQKLKELYRFTIDELCPELVSTMNFGVAVNIELKEEYKKFFKDFLNKIQIKINELLGFEFNLNSSQQKKKLFKDFFKMELKIRKRKGLADSETTDAQAMMEYVEEYPLLRPILTLMLEYNAIKVFTSTFLMAELDDDGRMRTQYHVAKTKTGRLASTKNVWGKGANLQNLPSGGKLPLIYALEILNDKESESVEKEDWDNFINSVVENEEEEFEEI